MATRNSTGASRATHDSSSAEIDPSPNGLIGTTAASTLENCECVLRFVLAYRDATENRANSDWDVEWGMNEVLAYVADALDEQARICDLTENAAPRSKTVKGARQ